jgi:hypothetical protein
MVVLLTVLFLMTGYAMAESFNPSLYTSDELSKIITDSRLQLLFGKMSTSPSLIYEDEYLSVRFSSFTLNETGEYMYTELLFENKTNSLINFSCDTIVINGYAVGISKYVEIPPNSIYLNKWTNRAEQYSKYPIDTITDISLVFDFYDDTNREFELSNVVSSSISIDNNAG